VIPAPAPYKPDPAILELADFLGDPVAPARFPVHILRFRNDRWDSAVGLGELADEDWIRHLGLFEPLPDNLPQPLALRYHGHQFRVYNPDLGDGRGFLYAQLRDGAGRLLDLGTKGSGQTPYSRFGDGRLTLKGGVREILATEMLEALQVNTSKSFSLIETGEALERNDEPSPTRSSVLVRLSHSHIRIGTFQRLAAQQDRENMDRLVRYCLRHYYGEEVEGPVEAAARLMDLVTERAAHLAASYLAAGFVHGVLNSDNISITAESFDYGPWRFTPAWDPMFTAAYFDHQGLYAFGRQPEAIHWDIVQLAVSLRQIAPADMLVPPLESYANHFETAFDARMLQRLGVAPLDPESDRRLATAIQAALEQGGVEIDRFFFDWRGGRLRDPARQSAYDNEVSAALTKIGEDYTPLPGLDHDYWRDDSPCTMHIDEVERIWSAIDSEDDWSAFEQKIADVRRMGEAMSGGAA